MEIPNSKILTMKIAMFESLTEKIQTILNCPLKILNESNVIHMTEVFDITLHVIGIISNNQFHHFFELLNRLSEDRFKRNFVIADQSDILHFFHKVVNSTCILYYGYKSDDDLLKRKSITIDRVFNSFYNFFVHFDIINPFYIAMMKGILIKKIDREGPQHPSIENFWNDLSNKCEYLWIKTQMDNERLEIVRALKFNSMPRDTIQKTLEEHSKFRPLELSKYCQYEIWKYKQ